MKKTFLLLFVFIFWAGYTFSQHHFLRITLDTKLMETYDYALGGGNGTPSPCKKVYAHLGLCTCSLDTVASAFIRHCENPVANSQFCYNQIVPYKSNVWQHVVGNWGENPQDDGVGLMQTLGNGVYSIEFCIEYYFSNPAWVNTEPDPNTSSVISTVWDTTDGGRPYTIGMVFRNPTGDTVGRDNGGNDLFIIHLNSGIPKVVQGSTGDTTYNAITLVTGPCDAGEGFDEIVHENPFVNAYPNPFSDKTQITYTLTETTNNFSIKVFNAMGQEVRTLCSGRQQSGSHSIMWDGTGNNAEQLPGGVYYFTLTADGSLIASQRIIISR